MEPPEISTTLLTLS